VTLRIAASIVLDDVDAAVGMIVEAARRCDRDL